MRHHHDGGPAINIYVDDNSTVVILHHDGAVLVEQFDHGARRHLGPDDRAAAVRLVASALHAGQPDPARQLTAAECAAVDALRAVVAFLPVESALVRDDWLNALYAARHRI